MVESRPDLVVLAGWMHILSETFLEITNGEQATPGAPALGPPGPSSLPSSTEPIPSSSTSDPSSTSAEAAPTRVVSETPSTVRFPIPIINLHPALPGAFDGANAIGRAYEAFQAGEIDKTGAMVHRVVAEVDRGEPLIVREVEIRKGQTLEQLEARIHEVEHQIIVEGAKKVLDELDSQEAQ